MEYKKFITYNATGGLVWVSAFTLLGYFFGNLPGVKENFSVVVIAIILLSITPMIIEFVRAKSKKKWYNEA
jgi:membrane-associated protein